MEKAYYFYNRLDKSIWRKINAFSKWVKNSFLCNKDIPRYLFASLFLWGQHFYANQATLPISQLPIFNLYSCAFFSHLFYYLCVIAEKQVEINDHNVCSPTFKRLNTPFKTPLTVTKQTRFHHLIFRFCSWAWPRQRSHNWPARCRPSCSRCPPYRSLHGCRPSQVELQSPLYLQGQHTHICWANNN